MRPVFISHLGLWCAAGASAEGVREALAQRRVPAGRLEILNQSFPYAYATSPGLPWQARLSEGLGAVAATLDLPSLAPEALFLLGSSSMQIGTVEATWPPSALPMENFRERVGDVLGVQRRGWLFTSACTSAVQALDAGVALIETGGAEEVLVLGVELLNRSTPAGFSALQLLSFTDARPLDQARSGLVLGEAVAAVRLSAKPSPWRIHAPALALDATSPTGHAADGSSIAQVMRGALDHAGLAPSDIPALKLQASGAPATDAVEARALRLVFGETLPALFSIKASLGHTLGACGLAELVAVLQCAQDGWLPPTTGFDNPDPELGLRPLQAVMPWEKGPILFNIQGFGGSLAAWVVEGL